MEQTFKKRFWKYCTSLFWFRCKQYGDIFLTGHTVSGVQNWDTYTMKIDNSGNQLKKIQGNPRGFNPKFIHDEAWGIGANSDGGCIVVAGTGENTEDTIECGTRKLKYLEGLFD